MPPTPPSISSSHTSGHSPERQYRVVRKRNRVPLSCAPCRSRKLKCNRAMPCENCVKRGDGPSCTYAQATSRKKNQSNQHPPTTPGDMQNRIDRLEGLVLSLMTNGSQSTGPSDAMAAVSAGASSDSLPDANDQDVKPVDDESDTEKVTRSFGVMKFDSKSQKTYYISEAHWAAILSDIAEVKQFFASSQAQVEKQSQIVQSHKDQHSPSSALIFGMTNPPNEAEIMASFPSKYTADILISRYFNCDDLFINVIHRPSFQRQYESHWKDPSKSSRMWMGMVFAIMRLALLSFNEQGDEPLELRGKSLDMAATYRNSMAQCLILADYTKPQCNLIEAMLFYLHAEIIQSQDAETSIWVLVGVIVRLAMRMGYHRESNMFPNISAFQGEMRRRTWSYIRQVDILYSFQTGLPGMIDSRDSDTERPHNLYDEDFDEDCTELPPERPFSEPTPVSYTITKARLTLAFGHVLEYTQKIKGTSYEEIMEVDRELRRASEMIPEHLRVRPMSECRNDSPNSIGKRFSIAGIYHKAQCVLHRPFLNYARDNPRYAVSRRTCIESSLQLLQFQVVQHAESRPGGLLQRKKWYFSPISSHDYLLASTIVALDLYHDFQTHASGKASGSSHGWGYNRQEEMITALRQSWDIWNELKDISMDAWKASKILGLLLEKLGQGTSANESQPLDTRDEKQNAAMTLGLLSSGMTPQGLSSPPGQFSDSMKFDPSIAGQVNTAMLDQTPLPASPFGMFGQMPDMQTFNLDWDAWDNYLQSGGLDSTQTWPTVDLQQLQQHPQSPIAPNRVDDGTTTGERPTYPATSAYPSAFSASTAGPPGDGTYLDPSTGAQGRRPE